jgi:hypothetical protein
MSQNVIIGVWSLIGTDPKVFVASTRENLLEQVAEAIKFDYEQVVGAPPVGSPDQVVRKYFETCSNCSLGDTYYETSFLKVG